MPGFNAPQTKKTVGTCSVQPLGKDDMPPRDTMAAKAATVALWASPSRGSGGLSLKGSAWLIHLWSIYESNYRFISFQKTNYRFHNFCPFLGPDLPRTICRNQTLEHPMASKSTSSPLRRTWEREFDPLCILIRHRNMPLPSSGAKFPKCRCSKRSASQLTAAVCQAATTFSNSSCGSMCANFLRALWHTRLEPKLETPTSNALKTDLTGSKTQTMNTLTKVSFAQDISRRWCGDKLESVLVLSRLFCPEQLRKSNLSAQSCSPGRQQWSSASATQDG